MAQFEDHTHQELLEELETLRQQRDQLLQNLKTTHAIALNSHGAFEGVDEIEQQIYAVKQELSSRAYDRDGPEEPTRLFLSDDYVTVSLDDYR